MAHLTRLHERALFPWLDHDDGTGGAADSGRRPAQEDINEAAFAMRPNDKQSTPSASAVATISWRGFPTFNRGVIEVSWVGTPARNACIFVAIRSSSRCIWVSR